MWSQVSAQAGMKKPVDEPAVQRGQAIPGKVALFSSTRRTLRRLPGRSMAPAFWPSPEQMKPPAPARPACPRRIRQEHWPISFRSRAPDKRPKVLMAKIRPDTRDLAEQAAAGSRKRAQKRPSGLCRAASMPSERGSISSQKPSACWARSAFCGSSCRQSTWNCRRASCQRPFQPEPAHRRAPSDPCLP